MGVVVPRICQGGAHSNFLADWISPVEDPVGPVSSQYQFATRVISRTTASTSVMVKFFLAGTEGFILYGTPFLSFLLGEVVQWCRSDNELIHEFSELEPGLQERLHLLEIFRRRHLIDCLNFLVIGGDSVLEDLVSQIQIFCTSDAEYFITETKLNCRKCLNVIHKFSFYFLHWER